MKRETFISLLSATLGEADQTLLFEAKNLVWSRERTLLEERVREFHAGQSVEYYNKQGHKQEGIVDHLNKVSVTIKSPTWPQGRGIIVHVKSLIGAVQK